MTGMLHYHPPEISQCVLEGALCGYEGGIPAEKGEGDCEGEGRGRGGKEGRGEQERIPTSRQGKEH